MSSEDNRDQQYGNEVGVDLNVPGLAIPASLGDTDALWSYVRVGTSNYSKQVNAYVKIGEDFGSYGDEPECLFLPESGTLKFNFPFRLDYSIRKPDDLQRRMQQHFGDAVNVQGTVLYYKKDGINVALNFSKQSATVSTPEKINSKEEFVRHLTVAINLHRALIQSYFEANNQQPFVNPFSFLPPNNPDDLRQRMTSVQTVPEASANQQQQETKILKPITETGVNFAMIIGQDAATAKARQLADIIHYMDLYLSFGAKLPKGILLYGPPGTGKTLIAKAIAQEAEATFVNLDISLVVGDGLVGQSEKATKGVFDEIKKIAIEKIVVVFIDEADKLLPSNTKGSSVHEVTGNRISSFAQFMDGVETNPNVVFILSTNDPQDVDQRILSRMSDHIEMPLPNKKELHDLLTFFIEQFTKKSLIELFDDKLDINLIVERCFEKELSGRDIRDIMEILVRNQGDKQLKQLQDAYSAYHNGDTRPVKTVLAEIFNDIATNKNNSKYSQYKAKLITTEDILAVITTIKSVNKKNKTKFGF